MLFFIEILKKKHTHKPHINGLAISRRNNIIGFVKVSISDDFKNRKENKKEREREEKKTHSPVYLNNAFIQNLI